MAAKTEQKWAKGLQQQGRGGWALGFQIKGKRQSMTVYCSQAEAAVVYDLAAIWANKQKGNNPENSTYYNFSILWYPREFIEHMVQLPNFAAVKEYTSQLLADGVVQTLVPFDGVGPMHRVRPNDTWKTQRAMELGVNARGIHFFSGSFWNCVLMEDVESFGADGRALQLSYRAHVNVLADRVRQNAMTTYHYKSDAAMEVYGELQAVAQELQRQSAAHVPRDLGTDIDPQAESADDSDNEQTTRRGRSTGTTHYSRLGGASEEEEVELEEDHGLPTPVMPGPTGRMARRGGSGAGVGRSGRGGGHAPRSSDSWGGFGRGSRSHSPTQGAAGEFGAEEEGAAGRYGFGHEEEAAAAGAALLGASRGEIVGDEAEDATEGPSKDELDLFRDFASIAAGTSPAMLRSAAATAAPALPPAVARRPPAGRPKRGGLLKGRKRRAVSEPVDQYTYPPLPSLRRVPSTAPAAAPVPAAAAESDVGPLFPHIPRRRRTDSFARSTSKAAGGGGGEPSTAVSPVAQEGSSEQRAPTITTSLATSQQQQRPAPQNTAQSRDSHAPQQPLQQWLPKTLLEEEGEEGEEAQTQGMPAGEGAESGQGASGGAARAAVEEGTDGLLSEGEGSGNAGAASPKGEAEVEGENDEEKGAGLQQVKQPQRAEQAQQLALDEDQQSGKEESGRRQQSSDKRVQAQAQQQQSRRRQSASAATSSAALAPAQRTPRLSRKEKTELVQLGGFPMLQPPFMPMLVNPASHGMHPMMMMHPMMAAPAAAGPAMPGKPCEQQHHQQSAAAGLEGAKAAIGSAIPSPATAGFLMPAGVPMMRAMMPGGMPMSGGYMVPAGTPFMPMMVSPAAWMQLQSGGSTKA